jgi:prevent-host-death family protein
MSPSNKASRKASAAKLKKAAARTESVAYFRKTISDQLDRVRVNKERVVIARHGRAMAALVPIEDYDYLEKLNRSR